MKSTDEFDKDYGKECLDEFWIAMKGVIDTAKKKGIEAGSDIKRNAAAAASLMNTFAAAMVFLYGDRAADALMEIGHLTMEMRHNNILNQNKQVNALNAMKDFMENMKMGGIPEDPLHDRKRPTAG